MRNYKNPLELLATDPIELNLISIKSKLMIILSMMVRDEELTQEQASKKLGVTQPRISNLMNGQLSKFSIDILLEMLGKFGYLLDITFNPMNKEHPIEMSIKKTAV